VHQALPTLEYCSFEDLFGLVSTGYPRLIPLLFSALRVLIDISSLSSSANIENTVCRTLEVGEWLVRSSEYYPSPRWSRTSTRPINSEADLPNLEISVHIKVLGIQVFWSGFLSLT
jgi:hypothetical protein